MKKSIILITAILLSVRCMAQGQLSFPFQGGKEAMTQFFKDSLNVSEDIIQKKAVGTAVFKFTANERGIITKIVVYYADDYVLTVPIIDALKKSNHKWIIPDREKAHDFIIPFNFVFNPLAGDNPDLQKAVYDNYRSRKPIVTNDQVPLNETTLLPVIVVSYDVAQ
jgi:hypothetical protein